MAHLALHIGAQLGLLLVVSGAAFGFGLALLSLLRVAGQHLIEHYLFAQALGYGVLSFVVLGLGVVGLYYPISAWVVLGVGLLLLAAQCRRLLAFDVPRLPRFSAATAALTCGLGAIILLAFTYALWANALVPPVSYDVVAYHFAIPKIYLAAHQIVYIPYIVYSNWPLGTEMLYVLGLLLGSEFLPQMLTWAFALIVVTALLCLARDRLPPATGIWAAALFVSVPMVLSIAGTGLVEMPLTAYTLLAIYAFWRWREEQTTNWLIVAGLLCGLAAATKLNGVATALVVGILVLASQLRARRMTRAARNFVILGLVSFLVVLPWYIKTWIFTGNPLWPFLQSFLGGRDWDALGTSYLLGYLHITNMAATWQNWLFGFWYVSQNSGRFGSFLMGPYFLALMPLGIFPAIFNRSARPMLANLGIAVLAMYTIWFALTHQTRFLLPATPFMALLAGAGLAWVGQLRFRPLAVAASFAVMVWLLAGAWVFNPIRRADWPLRWPYLNGSANRADFLTGIYTDYPVFSYVNQHLPENACVLMVPYDVRGYYLERPYLWGNIISQRFVRLEQFSSVTTLGAALQQWGVTHVWLNTRYVISGVPLGEADMQLIDELVASNAQLVFQAGDTKLFELKSKQPAGTIPNVCRY